MRSKHLIQRIKTCLSLADLSPCKRRQFGCVVIDPVNNVILSEGYNGNLRGSSEICGGGRCLRTDLESGTMLEVGCIHAEQNAIYNAVRLGTSLLKSWFIINGEPCKICAKAIIQVGALRVVCISGGYKCQEGVKILLDNNIVVRFVDRDFSNISSALDSPCRTVLPRMSARSCGVSPLTSPT